MRILLVEDDDQLRGAVERRLRRNGFAVDTAATMSEATEHLSLTTYHCLVLDRAVPGGDTISLVAEMRRNDDLDIDLARAEVRQSVETEPVRLDLPAEQIADRYPEVTLHFVPTEVNADVGLLTRAIDNLLRNAFAHGVEENNNAAVAISVYPTTLVVADSGPGIAGDVLAHLFDRFHTNETSNGHGLGLPIARWIVEAHGGTLTAENRPEGGATFTITFPKG